MIKLLVFTLLPLCTFSQTYEVIDYEQAVYCTGDCPKVDTGIIVFKYINKNQRYVYSLFHLEKDKTYSKIDPLPLFLNYYLLNKNQEGIRKEEISK